MKAVILAGGLGTRLQPYTLVVPKPLLPLGDKPILEHILEWLKKEGLREIVIATGYLGKLVENYFGDGSELGVRIEYARSPAPLGTAGQLKSAEKLVGEERFLLLYSDMIIDARLKPLIEFHEKKKALVTMMLMKHVSELRYGVIETEEDGRVREWREKPTIESWVNVGCYVMEPGFLKYIPEGRVYGMDEAFRKAIEAGEPIYAYRSSGRFYDVGDKSSYLKLYKEFLARMGRIP